ncbi:hypothetical protein GCM10010420_10830 [Streptomyces glaucosporus]|uniref:Uncharacterized protein n=1 Tax=Streptomyces glaucosporus TaxID=284044 RepID=A0ABN3HVY1_9ACTN
MKFDLSVTVINGQKALIVQPAIPDDAPQEVKNALATRREANATGVCPACGAVWTRPSRAERREAARRGDPVHLRMEHEDDCSALRVA